MKHKINVYDIQKGDLMVVISFVKVTGIKAFNLGTMMSDSIKVTDVDTGLSYAVEGNPLIQNMPSADRFQEEVQITRTEMIEKLMRSYNVPFTASFIKKDGSDRQLRGRLLRTEPLFGRSVAEDLDKPVLEGKSAVTSRMVQIDHRSLYSFIVDGIKYTLKK